MTKDDYIKEALAQLDSTLHNEIGPIASAISCMRDALIANDVKKNDRLEIAKVAMGGFCTDIKGNEFTSIEVVASESVRCADALLAKLAKTDGK